MSDLFARYARWLHLRWPAGGVERLPVVGRDGRTNVPGLFIAGDLAGVPLLKFALESGTQAVRAIAAESAQRSAASRVGSGPDLVILGAGVAGVAAAIEAKRLGMRFELIEAAESFSTVANFPKAKPIFTYPTEMTPAGELQVHASVKEDLLEELREQADAAGIDVRIGRAERVERHARGLRVVLTDGGRVEAPSVLVAIGRSGDFRRLGVPGEQSDRVSNRLHDPADFGGRRVLVVGGGDSALEAAIALSDAGAHTTLSYRGREISRAKPENVQALEERARAGRIALRLGSRVGSIDPGSVTLLDEHGASHHLPNDAVFTLIGREAPLAFLRRSGVRIAGDATVGGWAAVAMFLVALAMVYDWKASGFLEAALWSRWKWPGDVPALLGTLGSWWSAQVDDRSTVLGTVAVSMKSRSFYYTLLYTTLIGWFGWRRIRRRSTPYVTRQTLTLFLIQAIPLFLLPEVLLPWLGYNGAFDRGMGRDIADRLFESYLPASEYLAHHWPEWGHPRAYWRAYGFVLAWPLNVYNVFTHEPLWAWIAIGFVQTCVLIPLAVLRWGKGAYCGWVCSCGALAETLGDTQRTKMPHGPGWNRLNFVGQVFLGFACVLLVLRIAAWAMPASPLGAWFDLLLEGKRPDGRLVNPISYKWIVDILFGGVLGVGLYFKYSGRVWCRFACPLAAWMHVVARFSRFAIVSEKKKCISCNVCTSVCHQGIDVMAFASRGRPMQDPQCVRCSACVQSCPTGVLQFGSVGRDGELVSVDSLMASPVRARPEARS